jgi:hypothetical protein
VSADAARRLAWALFALTVALLATSTVFGIVDRHFARDEEDSPLIGLLFVIESLAWASLGTAVASRHPRNPIGWMIMVYGLLGGVGGAADGYAKHGMLVDPGSLPASRTAAWLADSIISSPPLVVGFVLFLLVLFPDGRLPSRRWRPAAASVVVALVALQALMFLQPGPLPGFSMVENPLGFTAVEAVAFLETPLFLVMFVALVASVALLVRRFRRAAGEERQQLKWVVATIALLAAVVVSGPIWWFAVPERVSDYAWPVLFALSLISVPLACGMAILRYRLYDIDVVIRRTLVYGVLSASLAGAYFGLVIFLQLVFEPLTQGSDLAIAGSTLAVAALFRPARRRIQEAVDRRFYRRRYDAQRTVESFAARLRDEVDLEALPRELRGIVHQTMQPAHVSLWLRGIRR